VRRQKVQEVTKSSLLCKLRLKQEQNKVFGIVNSNINIDLKVENEKRESKRFIQSNNRIFTIVVVLIITTGRNEFFVVMLNKFGDFSKFHSPFRNEEKT
jgi:hypothetical protein